MPSVNPELLLERLNWRYAVKKFDPSKKIPDGTWQNILKAATLAPSSFGLQLWKFIDVRSPELRQRLRGEAYNQPQVTDADHLMIFAYRSRPDVSDVERYIADIMRVRGVSRESLQGYANSMIGHVTNPAIQDDLPQWARRQVYIALGFYLNACTMLEVDACPMEGFIGPKFDEILGLTAMGYKAAVMAPAGYRANDDPHASEKKVRFPVEQTVVVM